MGNSMFLHEIFNHKAVLVVGGIAGSLLTFLCFCIYQKFKRPEIVEVPPDEKTKFEQLKLLFDYTKFHIGLYATLITGLIALVNIGYVKFPIYLKNPMYITVLCFTVAGAAGGIVGSNICRYKNLQDFQEARIGFWCLRIFKGKTWATLEHFFFWLGLVNAIAAVIFQKYYPFCWVQTCTIYV